MRFLAALLLALPMAAQIHWKFTPEPMSVPTAQVAGARDLGRWVVEACNEGTAAVTISTERVSMASPTIPWVDESDALLVLQAAAKRGFWAQLAHWAPLAAEGLAVGLGITKTISAGATVALSSGATIIPTLTQIAQGQVQSPTPLVSGVRYPVTLPPGGCYTDHRFAGKMKAPQIVMVTQ